MKYAILALSLVGMLAMAPIAEASILGGFLRKGPPGSPVINTIDDADAEFITKGVGNVAASFEVGDSVTLFLQFNNITSTDLFFFNTPLTDPTAGGAGYNLLANGTLTIAAIGDFDGDGDAADISWTGSIGLYEGASPIVFTSGIATATGVIGASTLIATVGVDAATDDFIVSEDAPLSFASIVGGATVNTFFGISLLAGGADFGIVEEFLNNPDFPNGGSLHDITGDSQAENFGPTITIGDDTFDLSTDLEFDIACVVPEPGAIMVWAGLAALFGAGSYSRIRKS